MQPSSDEPRTLTSRRWTLSKFIAKHGLDQLAYRFWRMNPRSLYRRFQHRRFDSSRNVQTDGYGDLRYEPTPEDAFRVVMAKLQVLESDLSQFTFIDIGSGKGKVLMLAADYPFRRLIGIEKFEDLHALGVENLTKASLSEASGVPVTTICIDAADYEYPDEPCVIYLFNPFAIEILAKVLRNIERAPQPLYVLFYAPILKRGTPWDRRAAFDRSKHLSIVIERREFTIYRFFGA